MWFNGTPAQRRRRPFAEEADRVCGTAAGRVALLASDPSMTYVTLTFVA